MKTCKPSCNKPAAASGQHLLLPRRLRREQETIGAMISLYCQRAHGQRALCDQCRELTTYARERVARCRYGTYKPVCGRCTTPCYHPHQREKIRLVMRVAGPRMLLRHPVKAWRHFWHWLQRPPQ